MRKRDKVLSLVLDFTIYYNFFSSMQLRFEHFLIGLYSLMLEGLNCLLNLYTKLLRDFRGYIFKALGMGDDVWDGKYLG